MMVISPMYRYLVFSLKKKQFLNVIFDQEIYLFESSLYCGKLLV